MPSSSLSTMALRKSMIWLRRRSVSRPTMPKSIMPMTLPGR